MTRARPTDRPSEQLAAAAPLSTKLSYVALSLTLFLSHAHNESMMGRMRQTDIRRALAAAAMTAGPRPRPRAAPAAVGRKYTI